MITNVVLTVNGKEANMILFNGHYMAESYHDYSEIFWSGNCTTSV